MQRDKPSPSLRATGSDRNPRAAAVNRSGSPGHTRTDYYSANTMNDWAPQLDHTLALGMASPMPVDMNAAHTMDHDALLEALVFMDDLDLSATEFATPVKHEPLGTFSSQLHGVIPAEAYVPPRPHVQDPMSLTGTNQITGQHTMKTSQPHVVSPSPSRSPSSPQPSTTSSTSPPVSPSTVSETKSTSLTSKPKGVVNRSRNRRREELQYLRSLVGELEDRLTTLRKRADEQEQLELIQHNGDAQNKDDPVLTAVWEDLAARQYAQRQRSEVENNKLRRMLEDQIQVGKSLERLLKRRSNADDLDVYLTNKRPRRASVSTAWNNAAIYDELLASLPAMYDELPSLFSRLSFNRESPNFRDIQVRNDPEMGVMIELTEARIFPFDYKLTTQEFWALFVDPAANDRFHYHDADICDDVLKVQFGMTVQVARTQGEFNMKIVSRRYVEENRTMVVWVGFCDPTEVSDTNMEGIYMRHKGWNIIEPLAPTNPSRDTAGATSMGTRVTSYSISVPETYEDVPDQKRKVGTLTNFMLSTADMQINERQLQLENRLVELSRNR